MEEMIYRILNRINSSTQPVTWYQLDRMFRVNDLHNLPDRLISTLDDLERRGLIAQTYNDDKPKLLSLTEKDLLNSLD